MARYGGFPPYVPVAERRKRAEREAAKRTKKGQTLAPVALTGKKIATTFWGNAWCAHLESFSDYENRLPRGRTYVRNGYVIDLQIGPRRATALVQGSELYEVTVTVSPLAKTRWTKVVAACAGKIDSLVGLLQGKLSNGVMEIVTHRETGLFPSPDQIEMKCSCPDWAGMCKHIAATLYGVGARLDEKPELLFILREVDHLALIETAGSAKPRAAGKAAKTIAAGDIADVFGIELEGVSLPPPKAPSKKSATPPSKAAPKRAAKAKKPA